MVHIHSGSPCGFRFWTFLVISLFYNVIFYKSIHHFLIICFSFVLRFTVCIYMEVAIIVIHTYLFCYYFIVRLSMSNIMTYFYILIHIRDMSLC